MCIIGTYFHGSSFVRSFVRILHGESGWMSLIVKPILEIGGHLFITNTYRAFRTVLRD